ncbi:hypothetical protein [Bradyrhizobium sp. SZCCHNRI2010]|uniref:hypothetical protein n=1 Tax=Bradyrhizobium sp. SZCCHNRI2010 TaxID=3057283 RepID=UPI0028E8D8C5|nr:hypothetical protein [Bradyrhizobium sp. SZCCHNRI2010]
MTIRNPITADEVIGWLRANTDRQDAGAANVARAIAIFEDAMRKMGRPELPPELFS